MGTKSDTMRIREATPRNVVNSDVNENSLGVISTPKGRAQRDRAVRDGLIGLPIESAAYWDTLRGGHERDVRNGLRPQDLEERERPPFTIREGGR